MDLSIPVADWVLTVSTSRQEMDIFQFEEHVETLPVSTSRNPASCTENSFGTPWGLHSICEKIGEDAPVGTVFKGRQNTGSCYYDLSDEENKKNLITSRILRLQGLEPGVNQGGNCDSFNRYIYIHGTNHENKIGKPASAGCIQMYNADIIRLFPIWPVNTLLWIDPS